MNPNYLFPSRYYSINVQGQGVSVRIIVLNTTPCITGAPAEAALFVPFR